MSVCSVAVGVLSLIAVVHILLSIVLGGLIAVVCYYGKLKRKTSQQVAQSEDSSARERSRALLELESPDKLYLSAPKRRTPSETTPTESTEGSGSNSQESETKQDLGLYKNRWTVSDPDFSVEELRKESFDQPAELSTSVEVNELMPRKRSRISMTSIASNLSNRFRKSADLESEDALRLMRERSSSERDSSERDTNEGVVLTNDDTTDNSEQTKSTTVEFMFVNRASVDLDVTGDESQC